MDSRREGGIALGYGRRFEGIIVAHCKSLLLSAVVKPTPPSDVYAATRDGRLDAPRSLVAVVSFSDAEV